MKASHDWPTVGEASACFQPAGAKFAPSPRKRARPIGRPRLGLAADASRYLSSGRSSPTEQSGGKKKHRAHQGEEGFKGHPEQPKRQRHQPDKWKENQCEQGQRPRNHEENAPADKKNQRLHTLIFHFRSRPSTALTKSNATAGQRKKSQLVYGFGLHPKPAESTHVHSAGDF